MYLLRHVAVEDYWRRWHELDQTARFLGLSPADRNYFWREQTADEYFHEWPVPMHHFLRDPYYVGPDVLVRDAVDDFLSDFFNPNSSYELFIFIGGIGAGKSFSASLGMEYGLYQLSCMRNPPKWLSTHPGVQISAGSEIVLINASAAGANQASKIVYGEIFNKVMEAPYFQHHFAPYPGKASELEFPHNIRMSPSTSKWQSVLGFNLFAFALDEAAFGIGGNEHSTTDIDYVRELFLNLNGRRRSRFMRLGFGGMFTSPGSEYGFVELMAGEGLDWDTTMLVRRITTWDAKQQVVPGAKVFLLDCDPDVVKILDSDLTYIADNREAGGELICQRANGEEVRVRNVQTDIRPLAHEVPQAPAS